MKSDKVWLTRRRRRRLPKKNLFVFLRPVSVLAACRRCEPCYKKNVPTCTHAVYIIIIIVNHNHTPISDVVMYEFY